jgi:uncharacterized membrane protein (DUF485 family)
MLAIVLIFNASFKNNSHRKNKMKVLLVITCFNMFAASMLMIVSNREILANPLLGLNVAATVWGMGLMYTESDK